MMNSHERLPEPRAQLRLFEYNDLKSEMYFLGTPLSGRQRNGLAAQK